MVGSQTVKHPMMPWTEGHGSNLLLETKTLNLSFASVGSRHGIATARSGLIAALHGCILVADVDAVFSVDAGGADFFEMTFKAGEPLIIPPSFLPLFSGDDGDDGDELVAELVSGTAPIVVTGYTVVCFRRDPGAL